jgi:starvation-inducible outer membrane lipoprotein
MTMVLRFMMNRRARCLACSLGFLLAGCTVGPQFERPTPNTPSAWHTTSGDTLQ